MKGWKRPEHLWVGINGKASGYHALKEAVSIARWLHAGVTAVAVAPTYDGDLSLTAIGSVQNELYKDLEISLRRAMEIGEELNFPIQIAAEGGDVCEALNGRASAAAHTNWIVIGAGRIFSPVRWLVGTALLSAVSGSVRPLLVVPEETTISGETVWLDLRSAEGRSGSVEHVLKWLNVALETTSWFGMDRLIIARPEKFPGRDRLQKILAERGHQQKLQEASPQDPLMAIDVVDVAYRSVDECILTMREIPPAFILIPRLFDGLSHSGPVGSGRSLSLGFLSRVFLNWLAPTEGIIRFPGKFRFLPASWKTEKLLRALPCPALIVPENAFLTERPA